MTQVGTSRLVSLHFRNSNPDTDPLFDSLIPNTWLRVAIKGTDGFRKYIPLGIYQSCLLDGWLVQVGIIYLSGRYACFLKAMVGVTTSKQSRAYDQEVQKAGAVLLRETCGERRNVGASFCHGWGSVQ